MKFGLDEGNVVGGGGADVRDKKIVLVSEGLGSVSPRPRSCWQLLEVLAWGHMERRQVVSCYFASNHFSI